MVINGQMTTPLHFRLSTESAFESDDEDVSLNRMGWALRDHADMLYQLFSIRP